MFKDLRIKLFALLPSNFIQFVKFCTIGLLNTSISFIVYVLLLKLGLYYLAASLVGYFTGVLNGYLMSSKFVFTHQKTPKNAIKFFSVYITSLCINLFSMYILVEKLSVHNILSQLIVTSFIVFYNYFLNKFWTFGKIHKHDSQSIAFK